MADRRKQDRVLRELSKKANGSFSIMYQALANTANQTGSSRVSKKDVEDEIQRLLTKQPA